MSFADADWLAMRNARSISNGRSERTRTFGLVVPNHALYQLSYAPTEFGDEPIHERAAKAY